MWWLPCLLSAAGALPDHLQVNYQRAPALGVGPALRFSWAVPAVATSKSSQPAEVQASYHIVITALDADTVVWDSGVVKSAASINVELDGRVSGLK